MAEPDQTVASVVVSPDQLALLDRFQQDKSMPSREAALSLLLDIAFEVVTSRGRRFWDKPVVDLEPDPPIEQPA